jgi:hypothetical protein
MITRVGALLLAMLMAGCVSYPSYRYVADPRGDYYYEAEPDGYGRGYGYAGIGRGAGCGFGYYGWWPHYGTWPCYSSWPGYGFYYGVTWFPRGHWGWYDHWAWYHPYSPYRHSYRDHYYDHGHWRHGHRSGTPRFGSASNEAERLANMAPRSGGAGAGGYGGAYTRGAPLDAPRWSRERDEGAGVRAAYPDVRSDAGWAGRGRSGGYSGSPVRYAPPAGNSGGRGHVPHRQPVERSGGFDRGGGDDHGSRASPAASRPWSESHNHGRERDPD